MSKWAISFIKPFIRGLKYIVYNPDKAWFRVPVNGKIQRGLPSYHNDVDVKHTVFKNIPVGIYTPSSPKPDKVILYFHGGGFTVCNYKMYSHLLKGIAFQAKIIVYAIDYRLAPEHPFPAGIEDCLAFYDDLRQSHPNCEIYLGGDSAGGGLVFSTALKIASENKQMPNKLFAFSPWANLTTFSDTYQTKANVDPLIDQEAAKKWALRYLNNHSAQDPIASPVFGSFKNFPPTFIHVGSDEVLLGDSQQLKEALIANNVQLHYKEWEGMTHVFQVFYPYLDEAKLSIAALNNFLEVEK